MDAEVRARIDAVADKAKTADPKGPTSMRRRPEDEPKAAKWASDQLGDLAELQDLILSDAEHIAALHETEAAKRDVYGEMIFCPGCRANVLAEKIKSRESIRSGKDAEEARARAVNAVAELAQRVGQ